jgi:hypothetical protein
MYAVRTIRSARLDDLPADLLDDFRVVATANFDSPRHVSSIDRSMMSLLSKNMAQSSLETNHSTAKDRQEW